MVKWLRPAAVYWGGWPGEFIFPACKSAGQVLPGAPRFKNRLVFTSSVPWQEWPAQRRQGKRQQRVSLL